MRPVLLLTLLSLSLPGAEPVGVATPFEVRRQAQELLDDLAHHRGEDAVLIERAQTLLAQNGAALIANDGGSAPISAVVVDALAHAGLADAFVSTYSPIAAHALADLGEHPDPQRLRALARAYPGTPAALNAWRLLADRAWDHGDLNLYLEYASLAGDTTAPAGQPRRARVDAAQALLEPGARVGLPPTLNGLTEIWRLPVEQRRATPSRGNVEHIQALMLTAATGDVAAASDGVNLVVVDHLVGRLEGMPQQVGKIVRSSRQCRPVAVRDGFVAAGEMNNQVSLTAVDHAGSLLWVQGLALGGENDNGQGNGRGGILGISAPVALDRMVAIATATMEDESISLQVHAVDAHTGQPLWSTQIARMPVARRQMMAEGAPQPVLCVQAGSLLVLSNDGLLARVGADGAVERIWSYATTTEDLNPGVPMFPHAEREGSLLSDGVTAVATPSDNAGVAVLLHGDGSPDYYRGDGAGGDVIATGDGIALLLSSRYLTCIDLATKAKRWECPLQMAMPGAQASLGPSSVLISAGANGVCAMLLVNLANGAIIAERTFPNSHANVIAVDQTLLLGGPDFIAAVGGSGVAVSEIEAMAKAHPDDYRPRVRLAGLRQAKHDDAGAIDAYLEALRLGAPHDCAERAARIVRDRLELTLGDDAFAATIDRLQALTAYDASLGYEADWWRARDAETRGNAAKAIAGYHQVGAEGDRLLQMRDGLQEDLRTLSQGGLYRLQPKTTPPLVPPAVPPVPAAATSSWHRTVRCADHTEVGGGILVSYANGFLDATRIADGTQAWVRPPKRPMLGIMNSPEPQGPRADGVTIKVLPGTSADAAGLRSGDVLQSFNGTEIHDFVQHLIPAVSALAPHSPYTAVVLRGDRKVECKGMIGGDLVMPVAANERTVLVMPVVLGTNTSAGEWIEVRDIHTGEKLFEPPTQRAIQTDTSPQSPVLTPDDVLVAADADDLIGLQVHALPGIPAGKELWRLPGRAGVLAGHAQALGTHLLWLEDPERGRGQLLDARSGQVLATLPSEREAPPIFDGFDAFVCQADLSLSCFDLGSGRERWRTSRTVADDVPDHAISEVLAAQGDAVYAVTQEDRLAVLDRASGQVRRLFPDWSAVASVETQIGDRLFLRVRDHGAPALAALSLSTGTVLWTLPVPYGAETQPPVVTATSLTLRVHEGKGSWVLRLGLDGTIQGVAPTDENHLLIPLAQGMLDIGSDGIAVTTPTLPQAPPPLPTTSIDGSGDVATAAAAAQAAGLRWCAIGGGAQLAVVRAGLGLLVFVKSDDDVIVHLGESGPIMDSGGMKLTYWPSEGAVRFDRGATAWHLTGQTRLGDTGPLVARVDPPADAPPLAVRLLAVVDSQPQTVPPWLMSAWPLLAHASPPASAPPPAPSPTPTPAK